MKIKLLLIFCCVALSIPLFSQGKSATDVSKEAKYIEALRENSIGRYDKGIKILVDLYEEDRTNGSIAFELAKAYKETDEHSLVDKYATNALKYSPNNVWYHLFYGDYKMEQNLPESAINSYKQIIDIEPENVENYDRLAKAYMTIKAYDKAIALFDQLENKFGPDPDVIMQKFNVYSTKGDLPNAIAEIKKLTSTYPNDEKYLTILAEVLLTNGQNTEAEETYKKILEVNPSNTEANLALLGTGTEIENEHSYLRALLPIIENRTINIDAKVKELIPYVNDLASGKNLELKDALIEAGDRIIQTHPNEAKAFAIYGDILYNSENIKGSIKQYEKTISLDNNIFPVWEQLMAALNYEEQFEELKNISEESIDLFPNQAVGYYFNGLALTKLGKLSESKDMLKEALIISGSNNGLKSSIYNAFASNEIASKNFNEAKEAIDKSLELSNKSNPITYEVLGDYFEAKNDKKAAMENWEKSQKMGNKSSKLVQKIEAFKS